MKILNFLFFISILFLHAQSGFQNPPKQNSVVRFQLVSNLILLPVNINGTDLTFILDSGVKETLLFSLEDKNLNLKNVEKINFKGLGDNFEVEGIRSENNIMKIGSEIQDLSHTVYIILNSEINFSERIGVPVHGIIGYEFFKNHPIQIDYASKKIIFYNNPKKYQRKIKRFQEFPVSVESSKPYLQTEVELINTPQSAKLLIDLGNSDALWLFPDLAQNYIDQHPHIDDYLGRGFNGDIFGKRGRIHSFSIGNFLFEKPIIAVPDKKSIENLTVVKDRKGSVGGEIWRRYTIILDYPAQKFYLKRNASFYDPFLFNKTGLEIVNTGSTWVSDYIRVTPNLKTPTKTNNQTEGFPVNTDPQNFQYKFILVQKYEVANCRTASPCELAGIKKGDQVLAIDRQKTQNMTLEKINQLLKEKKENDPIKLKIQRGEKIQEFELLPKDPVPYLP